MTSPPALVPIWVDGQPHDVPAGIPLGAALLGLGQVGLRMTPRRHQPRGLFCGMGSCFDCLVTIDGTRDRRACLALVHAGMRVETQAGAPDA